MSDDDLIGRLMQIRGSIGQPADARIIQAAANRIRQTSLSKDAIEVLIDMVELANQADDLSVEEYELTCERLFQRARAIVRTPAAS